MTDTSHHAAGRAPSPQAAPVQQRRIAVERVHVRDLATGAPDGWDELVARASASPFLSAGWLSAWWESYGAPEPVCLIARDEAGGLRAAAFCASEGRTLSSPTSDHSGEWGVLAVDPVARRKLWAELADLGARRVRFDYLPGDGPDPGSAAEAFGLAGYRTTVEPLVASPRLVLPASHDELMSSISGKLRSQLKRTRRDLAEQGELRFEALSAPDVDVALGEFFDLEASGWKARRGTAIASDARTVAMYTRFARSAAARGWLRLYRMTLDRRPIAASIVALIDGRATGMKIAFREDFARWSPGMTMQAEMLRALIAEGAREFDFLGSADPYKLRWGAVPRERVTLSAWRGGSTLPGYAWRAHLRPVLKRGRDSARSIRSR
jgi:CelD/BcsL family acetyltransferase involved in cellulose biosynthesis